MTTPERLGLLGECSSLFETYTGPFDRDRLLEWVSAELGGPGALDHSIAHGPLQCRALAPARLLHVVSENTPHAAFQSLLRGLVVGAGNLVKLPSSGLPELVEAVERLPAGLALMVQLAGELPLDWKEWAQAIVVFGNDETLDWFAANTPPVTRLLPHGQRLSIAVVNGDIPEAARLAARDVSLFDQRGCLSIHDIYLTAAAGVPVREFAILLAEEMERFNEHTPRADLSVLEAGRITAFREEVRFAAATHPHEVELWCSTESTHWTVVHESDPLLKVSPLQRVVYVKPWPESDLREALGAEARHLSTIASHPFDSLDQASLVALGATRLCPLGNTHQPSLFWHHDGLPPLASLVKWVDIG